MVKNKELQEERMRGYFTQATKDILKAEGLKSLSVRGIAERAGYSYTTMYNYFRDVNELVFLCVEDFQKECRDFVGQRSGGKNSEEKLRSVVKSYASYFIEYPGIFELFYLERMGDLGHKQKTTKLIASSFELVSITQWKEYGKEKNIQGLQLSNLIKQTHFLLTGMLLFYLNRRTPVDYTDFMKLLDKQLEIVLSR